MLKNSRLLLFNHPVRQLYYFTVVYIKKNGNIFYKLADGTEGSFQSWVMPDDEKQEGEPCTC